MPRMGIAASVPKRWLQAEYLFYDAVAEAVGQGAGEEVLDKGVHTHAVACAGARGGKRVQHGLGHVFRWHGVGDGLFHLRLQGIDGVAVEFDGMDGDTVNEVVGFGF